MAMLMKSEASWKFIKGAPGDIGLLRSYAWIATTGKEHRQSSIDIMRSMMIMELDILHDTTIL